MATLREVAELASVSVATASRVLNGSTHHHPVSTEIQAAVRAAATTLGYMPSAAARALKQQRSRIIGVIASDILDPYFAELTRGIEVEAARAGYSTVIANANRDPQQERTKFRVLREHRAQGIVFCGSDIEGASGTAQLAREVNAAVHQGTRVVALAPRGFSSTSIVVDNATAAVRLTEYLLSLGHRDIVCIGGIPGLSAAEQRVAGYRSAMFQAGAVPRVVAFSGMTKDSGKAAMAELTRSARLPDAIICTNDEVAIGALAHLWTNGYRVPEDISVAGIGGTRASAVFGLTTVTLPLTELGTAAARFITDPAAQPAVPATPAAVLRPGLTTRAGSAEKAVPEPHR
ncbi:LacI family DNA-binding transcriptional regulator [Streptomyces odontomachi]|uniref:LacI family DNA-binding transcriptional regulator n=1 Tax=Streptomyces odontomachi TaxID=2944940 RepID=UPI00210EC843|nr:LacI family DNA-binding transcriptional regulator [Streptomyces sp. ODS25]